jgi:lysophospholipase L1-like esterase
MKFWKRVRRLFFIFLIVLFVSELAVRLIFDTPPLSVLEKTNVRMIYGDNYEKLLRSNQTIYHSISKLDYDPTNLRYRINNLGYRGDDFNLEKKEGEIVIVIIGGSHIFDIYATHRNGSSLFTSKLEENLRKKGMNAKIINAGISGQDLKSIILRMKGDIQKLNPDYILLNSTHNDIRWINYTDTSNMGKAMSTLGGMPRESLGINPFNETYNWSDRVFGFSKVYLRLRSFYWYYRMGSFMDKYRDIHKQDYPAGISNYEKLVNEFIYLSRNMGAKPVLCLEEHLLSEKSTLNKSDPKFQFKNIDNSIVAYPVILKTYKDCDAVLNDAAKKQQIPLIDLSERFSNRKDLFEDLIHTNNKGSSLMAELYTAKLFDIIRNSK